MASLRVLPSGKWQAAVLIADGKRRTKAFSSEEEAIEWALEVEEERERIRAELREKSDDVRVAWLVAELAHLIEEGRLSPDQLQQLHTITSIPAPVSAPPAFPPRLF